MIRPVYFVKYYDKGSTVMGADQMSAALRAGGLESRAIYPQHLEQVSDAILVFIKTSRWHHLWLARRRRNRLVLDVQDTVVFKRRVKNAWAFDGMIFKNARQLRDFGDVGRRRRLDRVIYHQWDPRFSPHLAPPPPIRVGYFGLKRSFPLWGRVPGVACIDHEYFRRALNYNCHLSTREPGRDALYKPNCKVSTAAACGAVLITTRDESAVELLGDDYPYFTTPDEPSIVAAIDRVRATAEGPEWTDALARLRAVKDATALARIRDEYVRYFTELS